MNTHWKIFNIVNLICLTFVISIFAWPLFTHPGSIHTLRDKVFYAVVIIIILVVIINCLHNIFLTRLCADGGRMTLTRQIFFWILLVLFAVIMSLFIYNTCQEVYFRFYYKGPYRRAGGLLYFNQFVSLSVTGLYLVIAQIILFFTIRKSYRCRLDNSVNEIGN